MRNIRPYLSWIIILLIIVSLAGYKIYSIRSHSGNTPQKTGGAPPPVPVSGFVTRYEVIENIILSNGNILANEEVVIQPEISGRVTGIYFKEGTTVQKGTLLVKLYDSDLQAQLQKLRLQEELAVKTEKRLKELSLSEAVSLQEYDEALNQLNTVRADIELLKAQIQKTEIRAPFSGKIGLRNISTGAYVSPGTEITTLQQIQPLRVDFSVPEKYYSLINSKAVIEFTVQGLDEIFSAPVIAVEPRIDPNTRSLKIRALYPNKELKVFPGSFATVRLPLEKIEQGIMIPTQSVIPELKGQKVYISENGKASPRTIITGMRNDSTVQIISGLSPGDTVITTGILQVRPGSDLKFTNIQKN